MRSLARTSLGTLALVCAVSPALAITASITERTPSVRGEIAKFQLEVTDAVGDVQVRWDLGDETRSEFTIDDYFRAHVYDEAGHYPVLATVKDEAGFTSVSFVHTVHEPLVEGAASVSSDVAYERKSGKIYTANEDNDSISVVDALAMTRLGEVPVARGPVSVALLPNGKLWVLSRDASALSIVNTASLSVEREIPLPRGAQPMGLALSADAAFVSLMATGKLLKLDLQGQTLGELDVGPTPRGVSVSHDGAAVFVTRFISSDSGGEVLEVDAATLTVARRFDLAPDTTTPDTDQAGRGLPNYLFSVGLSPDGLFGWVPGKKDNIYRGLFRDEQALTDDNTVRPLISLLDLGTGKEKLERRIDLDDRNLPNQVVFSEYGDYAFVSVAGSALVEVRDAYTGGFVTALKETGFAPRGLVLTERRRLFVHAPLSRSLAVYDVADILDSHDFITKRVADVPTVTTDKLTADVLRGKQLFYNSADVRMSDQGYLSCASCHFDGGDDGRTWDFASVGEGLRNTISLLGRRGMGQGRLNWSGSFDELQDVDDNIRDLFGGKGFLSDEQVATGSVASALGDKKAGLSSELDAMAAFMSSLAAPRPSPFRNPDGSLSADGVAGRDVFRKLGCGFCHTGSDTTDSAAGKRHDVGTLSDGSGSLLDLDTPTLNGVWETPPYLHDGSAPTLRDVLTTSNPDDRHAFTSALSEQELTQLVAYVQQLDGTVDPEPSDGAAGGPGVGAGGMMSGSGPPAAGGCSLAPSRGVGSSLWLASLLLLRRRRR